MYYILNEKYEPVKTDYHTWLRWHDNCNNRVVAHSSLSTGAIIETLFVGLTTEKNEVVLFETMIILGGVIEYGDRYDNCNEAIKGHANTILKAINSQLS